MPKPLNLVGYVLILVVLMLTACRSPFPPALGSGQVIFQESPGVHVTVAECTKSATYTVALREEIERAGVVDGLVLIFHDGPSRYLGGGYAEVHCEDWGSIARLIEEHREYQRQEHWTERPRL